MLEQGRHIEEETPPSFHVAERMLGTDRRDLRFLRNNRMGYPNTELPSPLSK